MHRRRAATAMAALAVAGLTGACSGSGDGTAGVRIAEVPVQVDGFDTVAAVVGWQRGFVAVTAHGLVYRSDDARWTRVNTTGLAGESNDDESAETRVVGLAAGDGFLLAVGTRRTEISEDDTRFAPLVWRSDNAARWEQVEAGGLTARAFDTLVFHAGGFLAFGTEEIPSPPGVDSDEDEEDGAEPGDEPETIFVTSTWRSDDGAQWERVGENVLPPGENSVEDVASVAIVGDRLLASLGTECAGCYDDYNFALSRSDDGGETWRELEESGLDDNRQANTDVIPHVVGFGDRFVAVGTSEDGDDTVATLWGSADGERWTDKTQLGGPRDYEYAESIDAMVATETGVVILELRGDRLAVWRVDLS